MDEDTTQAAWYQRDDDYLRAEMARILSYWCVVRWNPERGKFELLEEGHGNRDE